MYILGDIAHRTPVIEVNNFISMLNGKKILCKGNHDKRYDPSLVEGIYGFLEIAVHGVNIYHGSLDENGRSADFTGIRGCFEEKNNMDLT